MRKQSDEYEDPRFDGAVRDFVLVTVSCVISPSLQISVNLGRFDLEMNGVQMLDCDYDSLITSDYLMMPETESSYYIKPAVNSGKTRMVPFYSNQRIRLFSIGFSPRVEGSSLIYSNPHYDSDDAKRMARLLAKKLDKEGTAPDYSVLASIFCAIGQLKDWPTSDIGIGGCWERVEVRFGLSFLQVLTESTKIVFPQVSSNEGYIAIHELRS